METRQELAVIAGVSHDTIARVEKIEAAADAAGESLNEYTKIALLQRMGLDEWPMLEEP